MAPEPYGDTLQQQRQQQQVASVLVQVQPVCVPRVVIMI